MLQSLKKLYGDRLDASDGEIGQVEDFYFDDRDWAVRYIVADTGTWLTGQQVLLSPHAFGDFHATRKLLSVNLTRKQIENGPPIAAHKPVSRQYEEVYHKYYGWPSYWEGAAPMGVKNFPILESVPDLNPNEQADEVAHEEKRADAHLLSTQAVTGYHVHASEEIIGHVSDFLMDAKTWTIGQLVVKIGHRFSGKEVQIPVSDITKISYEQSTVFVKLTKEAIEKSPAPELVSV